MKKILEVLWYGDHDLRFNTDLDQAHLESVIPSLASSALFTMLTKLWGGKESAVLAVIRALSLADLAASSNREEMLRQMDESSRAMVEIFQEARREFEKKGGKIITFGPGVKPPKMPS